MPKVPAPPVVPLLLSLAFITTAAAGTPQTAKPSDGATHERQQKQHARSLTKTLTKEARLAFIRRAQVWTQTNVPQMNLRAGPQGNGAFPPDAQVTCDYVQTKLSGTSRKFDCVI